VHCHLLTRPLGTARACYSSEWLPIDAKLQ
jgi:hypothetical protein